MIKQLILRLLHRINNRLDIIPFNQVLEYFIVKNLHRDFYFVQIGGNDGVTYDPLVDIIKRRKLSGLIVEPIKTYFNQLYLLYQNCTRVSVANYAIYSENGPIAMFKVKDNSNDLPVWAKGIASIDKEHFKKSNIPESEMEEEIVEGITLENLFLLYKIERIDLLVIDVEGYDYNLIKSINFEKFKPSLIYFEHGYLDNIMSQDQILEIFKILLDNNYKFLFMDYDCLAYL